MAGEAPYLIVHEPQCSGCYGYVQHDGDSYYCDHCGATWGMGAWDGDVAIMNRDGNPWGTPPESYGPVVVSAETNGSI